MEQGLWWFWGKTLFSALFIAGVSTLSERHPQLAGFLTALPLTSLLVLSLTYARTGDGTVVSKYGVAIFAALPVSLLFFVPFLFYERLKGSFWWYLLAGLALLYAGYFVHRAVTERWLA